MKKLEFNNGEQETVNTSQKIYDSFNDFIFSEDIKVFSKLVFRSLFFNKVINIPGDIVECGVFKGSGILTWLKLKRALCPHAFKKIIGFDMFDSTELLNIIENHDKKMMSSLFENRNFEYKNYQPVLVDKIEKAGFNCSDYELIQGDVCKTAKEYVSKRPGCKISLLYLDMDIENPTYEALSAFWPNISKNGYVVLDEYGYNQWSESIGVDRFARENNLTVYPLHCNSPTAFIKKV